MSVIKERITKFTCMRCKRTFTKLEEFMKHRERGECG